ncbi:lysophospholipid acyltransferase family protein [Abyssisolibacter fermentans]|uniref:lysophospholipid acyltransferase family protein n=1 Tax=Abyssisolibacter fermentans TaxID=1766203 RepID=UPI00082B9226|nr:lysophospholipid acyltransferase family protein [Abyssisolibacter fermentans]
MSLYNFCKNTAGVLIKIIYKIEAKNVEKIPKEGKIVICGNHVSLLDPVIVGIICPRKINFMAKKELFNNILLRKLFLSIGAFPVDRAKADVSAIKKSLKLLKNEEVLGIFPEGTRVKTKDSSNTKAGISMIAIKAKAPVLPVYIDTNYKLFSKVKINIGDPIFLDEYYGKKNTNEDYKTLSIDIMDKLYSLK